MQKSNLNSKKLTKPIWIITSLSALNMILGFAVQMVLAAQFGTSIEMDSYLAASSIPMLVTLVLISSLNIALVPVYIELDTKHGRQDTWRVVSGIMNLGGLALIAIIVVGMLTAPLLIRITTPGFIPGTRSFILASRLFMILIPSIFFTGLAAILKSIYYAENRFFIPSLSFPINSLCMLVGTILLKDSIGIYSVAVGTLIGSVSQFVILIPIMVSGVKNEQYSLYFNANDPAIRRVLTIMLPWVAGALIYKANPLIDRFVASFLPEGSISSLAYALKLSTALVTLVTQGISISIFPLFSRYAAENDVESLCSVAISGMRLIFFLVFPMAVGIIVLHEPIVRLLLQRGSFDAEATSSVGWALVGYMGAFVITAVGTVLTRVYYALQDTLTVMKVSIVGAAINFIGAIWLTRVVGYIGPALAYSFAATINFIILFIILEKRTHGFNLPRLYRTTFQTIGISGIMGILLWIVVHNVSVFTSSSAIVQALNIGIVTLFAIGFYFLATYILGIEEAYIFRGLFFRFSRFKAPNNTVT